MSETLTEKKAAPKAVKRGGAFNLEVCDNGVGVSKLYAIFRCNPIAEPKKWRYHDVTA